MLGSRSHSTDTSHENISYSQHETLQSTGRLSEGRRGAVRSTSATCWPPPDLAPASSDAKTSYKQLLQRTRSAKTKIQGSRANQSSVATIERNFAKSHERSLFLPTPGQKRPGHLYRGGLRASAARRKLQCCK